MENRITFLAKTTFRKKEQVFGIKKTDRRQHMYVIGKTGVGKSTFLKNMALQDINNGEGLAIVDPHGEFAEEVLASIPPERIKDVVYFNPADTEYPVSFNVLEVTDEKYKHLVASGLIGIFTKIWANVWSARMEYILANAILALLDTPGTTLLGIPRMLVDKEYRRKIIDNLKDPVVKSFWLNEYEEWSPSFRNEAIAPIQNKVGQFLNVSLVRNIVGQSKSTIDIAKIMNEGKILLVNVSKGRIGEDNSAILGAMIITKIQLMAMERVRIPEDERKDFYLYVDEFQNFATDSFVNVLSEARKYRLNLVIAHQYIGQLVTETTTAVRDAVFGNVGTMVCFRVGAGDAEFLEQEFSPEFEQTDLVSLPNYNVYLKLMIDGVTCRPFSAVLLPPKSVDLTSREVDKIISASRERYSFSVDEVEKKIAKWSEGSSLADPKLASKFPKNNSSKQNKPDPQNTTLYDAKCDDCGKWTKVIFKPSDDKPSYCKSCLKKRKAAKNTASIDDKKSFKNNDRKENFKDKGSENKEKRSLNLSDLSNKEPVFFGKKPEKKEVDFKELKESITNALDKNEEKTELKESDKIIKKEAKENSSEKGSIIVKNSDKIEEEQEKEKESSVVRSRKDMEEANASTDLMVEPFKKSKNYLENSESIKKIEDSFKGEASKKREIKRLISNKKGIIKPGQKVDLKGDK